MNKKITNKLIERAERIKECLDSLPTGARKKIALESDCAASALTSWSQTGQITIDNLFVLARESGYSVAWLGAGIGEKRDKYLISLLKNTPFDGFIIDDNLTPKSINKDAKYMLQAMITIRTDYHHIFRAIDALIKVHKYSDPLECIRDAQEMLEIASLEIQAAKDKKTKESTV